MDTVRLCEQCFPTVLADRCERFIIQDSILPCQRCGADASGVRVFPTWGAFVACHEAWARAAGVTLPPHLGAELERPQGEFGADSGRSGMPA